MDSGFHYTIDAFGCDHAALINSELMFDFLKTLPESVGMKVIGGPYVKYYNNEDIIVEKEEGPTGVVVLAESHASLHSYPHKQYLAFDLFSCKEFDKNIVKEQIISLYKPQKTYENFLNRGFTIENLATDTMESLCTV